MTKQIIIDTDSFEVEKEVFEKSLQNIKEIFESEKKNTEKISGNDVWKGMTQEIMYEKKKEFQENFDPVEEAIQKYIDFMGKTIEDYENFEMTTNNSIENGLENLDVNSQ